jgi:tetratricopeptide (TPR) repeat protein
MYKMTKKCFSIIVFFFISLFLLSCENSRNDRETLEQKEIRFQIEEFNFNADRKLREKDYLGAISLYNESLRLDRRNFKALTAQAYAYFENKNFPEAIRNYTILIEEKDQVNSERPYSVWDYYLMRGKAKYYINDLYGALSDFDYVLDDGGRVSYYNVGLYRGMVHLKLNRTKEACLDFSKAGQSGRKEAYELISRYCN